MGKRKRKRDRVQRHAPSEVEAAVPTSPWIAAAVGGVLLACIVFLCLTHISDSDTWWHLKTGELIWRGGIPRTDPFSYVIEGRPWLAFEWLSQALFYPLFRFGGAAALTVFKTVVIAAAFLLLWRIHPARPAASAVVVFFAALSCRTYFVERPWIFDFLFVSALCAAVWRISFRSPPKSLRWSIPLATVLWVNLHGGAAVLAPVLVLSAAAAERLRDREVSFRFWCQTAALTAAALLVNPHGFAVFTHLWGTLTFEERGIITEWNAPGWELRGIYGVFLAAAAAAWLPTARRRPAAAAWMLILGAASLNTKRNIPLFLIAAAPALAAYRFAREPGAKIAALSACALMIVGIWTHTLYANVLHLRRLGVGADLPFAGALAFLEQEGITGRMFNEYESGGPLIWRAGPRRKVFIDGRSLEYGAEHVRAAMSWYQPEVWKALDAKYDFDYAIVRRHTRGVYTALVLDLDPAWRLVYWDDEALVYLKARAANEALIREHGYRLLQPGRGTHQYLERLLQQPELAGMLMAELDRTLVRTPDCVNALLMKAYVHARSGDFDGAAQAARRAVAAHPGRAQPRLTLAWIEGARGELERARKVYEEALDRVARWERPTLGADILNNLGRIEERRGDAESAAGYYRRTLRWNPRQEDAVHNLKRLEKSRGRG